MKLRVSKRSSLLTQSEIRNMSIECDKIDGINLSQGVCDLETPLPVRLGAKKAIDAGYNQYSRYDGIDELRQAIAKKMWVFNKIKTDPDKNIIVSSGSTGAFYSACLALLNPGDEVILFEPYYGYHVSTLLAAEAVPVYVKLSPQDWAFKIIDLEKIVSEKTKGIMINTPANPSGKVFSKDELKILATFAIKHDLFIFTDEIYEYFVYDNKTHMSPGSLPEIADRTITISGYSKTYSITGWRIGYSVSHQKWTQAIGYINDLVYVCAPTPLQFGVAQGIMQLKQKQYTNLRLSYTKKRDKFCAVLNKIGIKPYVPEGAYYVLADASGLPGKNSKEKAMYLLKKTKVAAVPGSAFYHDQSGEKFLRFCFAVKDNILDEACERLLKLKY